MRAHPLVAGAGTAGETCRTVPDTSIAELVAIAGMGVGMVRVRRAPHPQHVNLAGVAAQDLEHEVVDTHLLAAMRHAPEAMRDEAADGVDFVVGILGAEL